MSAQQPAPTFATAITLARATWGKTALVRLTWIADSWVASAGPHRVAQGAAVSRGVVTDHVTVRLPVGGQLLVPVAVAWAQCACGEHLGWVGDARDNAVAGLR